MAASAQAIKNPDAKQTRKVKNMKPQAKISFSESSPEPIE